ncbi:MAG: DUF86 domain-containing protein [Actinomycetota bacterium]|jgi:uncharacterized protein with HEPN domain|nr:DUF86 domain-containing protein [Euzebyaceae bacterium]MDQ3452015.1 DUF86 domain-containing protein [Actinomycetota bacterium]
MPRSLCDRLADVLSALDKAERFGRRDRSDDVVVAAILHELTVVGEAVSVLLRDDPDLLERRPDIPWRGIVGMRNRLVHEYENVEPAYVWGTVDDDLQPLRLAVDSERDRLACA